MKIIRKFPVVILSLLFCAGPSPAQVQKKVIISEDLELSELVPGIYVHTSYASTGSYRHVPANGLLVVNGTEALMIDSPWNDSLTMLLTNWLSDSIGIRVTGFIPGHWHEDCMGGLGWLQSQGIKTWSGEHTREIAVQKGLPVPDVGFTDSLNIIFGQREIRCYYPGPAHSTDNIVILIEPENILFAGCLVKSMGSTNLGNTADGDLKSYSSTMENIIKRFPDPQIVVPGHGACGGAELLRHTLELSRATAGISTE
ncbi:MAG: subclass B1 metallo-beta-lactamase [Bacteroidota bacterium]